MKAALLDFYENRKRYLEGLDGELIDDSIVYDRAFGFCEGAIMLIGEAPGETEAREGRPFCGPAGKNLAKLIEASDIKREKLLISNAFGFRTLEYSKSGVKNRTPSAQELKIGAKMLIEEIGIVKPKMIVLLGGSAEKAFLKIEDDLLQSAFKSLQKHEIKEISYDDRPLLIAKTHHPSPLVFNRADKRAELYEFFSRLNEYAN